MKPVTHKKIGIIIPAYNEAGSIQAVLTSLPRTVRSAGHTYDIHLIVVNDGSSDATAKIIEKLPRVHLINHLLNSGAGAATRTGMTYAEQLDCDYIVTMDADGQHHPDDVVYLINEITKNDADFIIGSRLINSQGMPWYRVVGNKGLGFFTMLLFGVFVSDSQSGLKAMNRTALHSIEFHSNNFAFCSEMIWMAHRHKLTIQEVPIKAIYTDYSLAKGQSNWDGIHIVRQLLKRRLMDFIHE